MTRKLNIIKQRYISQIPNRSETRIKVFKFVSVSKPLIDRNINLYDMHSNFIFIVGKYTLKMYDSIIWI